MTYPVYTLPAAPIALQAVATSDSSIELTWTNISPSATSVTILAPTDDYGDFTYYDSVPATQSQYTVTGLDASTSYQFEVEAEGSGGSSSPSNEADATTPDVPSPAGLTATVVSTTQIDLSWTNNADDATGFEVDWQADGSDFQSLAQLDASTTTCNIDTYVPGTNYTFLVEALAAGGTSEPSETTNASTIPSAPTGMRADVDQSGTVNLSWNDVAGASSFIVESSQDDSGWQTLATTAAGQTSCSDDSIASGGSSYYRVRAFDATNMSDPSGQVDAIVLGTDALSATSPAADEVDLNWSNGPHLASQYFLDQQVNGNYQRIATLGGGGQGTYNVTGLESQTSYTFRLTAVGDCGRSNSITTSATTPAVDQGSVPPNDDGSSDRAIAVGFPLNFYGVKSDKAFQPDRARLWRHHRAVLCRRGYARGQPQRRPNRSELHRRGDRYLQAADGGRPPCLRGGLDLGRLL